LLRAHPRITCAAQVKGTCPFQGERKFSRK
jgi:hypothetical protein